ncbi:unnamed protein product [Trichobilharzia regenti]|nr:unnamed protein product [Trichobilharzia regenti]
MKHIPIVYQFTDGCSISRIVFNISGGCNEEENELWPSASMDESYSVKIDNGTISIHSEEIWGTLHAFETILQLVYRSELGQAALSIMKMNVLHWHMTDDESFPYSSTVYPELSSKGAYHPREYVYERGEIGSLIEFARLRGVRVIVEFDTPGHTLSWGKGHPEILSGEARKGPINPTYDNVRTFLSNLFQEILSVFHDDCLHLGAVYLTNIGGECTNLQIDVEIRQLEFRLRRRLNTTTYNNNIDNSNFENIDRSCTHISSVKGTEEETKLVIGGEFVIWGTYVDDTNLLLQSW